MSDLKDMILAERERLKREGGDFAAIANAASERTIERQVRLHELTLQSYRFKDDDDALDLYLSQLQRIEDDQQKDTATFFAASTLKVDA